VNAALLRDDYAPLLVQRHLWVAEVPATLKALGSPEPDAPAPTRDPKRKSEKTKSGNIQCDRSGNRSELSAQMTPEPEASETERLVAGAFLITSARR
jgi:hypothetical protein